MGNLITRRAFARARARQQAARVTQKGRTPATPRFTAGALALLVTAGGFAAAAAQDYTGAPPNAGPSPAPAAAPSAQAPVPAQPQAAPPVQPQPAPTNQPQPAPTYQPQPAPTYQPQPAPTYQPQPAPSPSALAPTQADYSTAAGNVPPGVEPREFKFTEPYRPRTEASFMIGVPIWFTPKDNIIQPGISFEARIAHRLGLIAPELTLGWQTNWLNEQKLSYDYYYSNLTVDSFFLSGGARLYVLRDALVTPFISGALDLTFWHFAGDTSVVCGYWYCSNVANYDPGLGFSGRAGLAFMPSPRLQIEFAAKLSMVLPIGPFRSTQAWVTPYFGLMSRF